MDQDDFHRVGDALARAAGEKDRQGKSAEEWAEKALAGFTQIADKEGLL
jgi:hypothetical protein